MIDDSGSVGEPCTERMRPSEKKILNIQPGKEHAKEEETPNINFVTDEGNDGKSEKEELEDDTGLDSEQDDPTGKSCLNVITRIICNKYIIYFNSRTGRSRISKSPSI